MKTLDIVIPSFQRGAVLLDTINILQKQKDDFETLIIVDQTDYSANDQVLRDLESLAENGTIDFIREEKPSIPNAMNIGLLAASSDLVLFLDDDITPSETLVAQHKQAYSEEVIAVVGQILQPGEVSITITSYPSNQGFDADLVFPFYSDKERIIQNCMAGNLSVDRQAAIDCGGFDTNFIAVAYRFETEFCRRLIKNSGKLFKFSPAASIHHLKISTGGTRNKAKNFLTSMLPDHSVGEYYFVLRESKGVAKWYYVMRRYFGSLRARYYVLKPWWIPIRLIAEARGFCQALSLNKKGPQYIKND